MGLSRARWAPRGACGSFQTPSAEFSEGVPVTQSMARSPGSAPSWLPGALESESWTEAGGGRGSVSEARGFEPQKGILICMETFISGHSLGKLERTQMTVVAGNLVNV